MNIQLNTNDYVEVTLTVDGAKAWNKYNVLPDPSETRYPRGFRIAKGGTEVRMKLWTCMAAFGSHLRAHAGYTMFVDNEIRLAQS